MKLPRGVLSGLGLAMCTFVIAAAVDGRYLEVFEPQRSQRPDESRIILVTVESDQDKHLILGELYRQGLERHGRQVSLSLEAVGSTSSRFRFLEADANVAIVCTGSLLEELNRPAAAELVAKFEREHADFHQQREELYAAVMAQLSDHLNAADPSNAIGCHDSNTQLPEHILPLYQTSVLDRDERNVLNIISGAITNERLDAMVAQLKNGSAREVVAKFLDAQGLEF
ncbi:hypothetical protein [Corynebacterium sp. HS2168-gen11]|uniref:hypothetical protein n=1 Tax=Corynebacterium sp. HS2168-gen11 TaxID=2974027 RepID=UPI00216AEC6B|nr:hypothetical protein [Corynebacterium sp. HS2168-gen11]MCS4534907.1 hypothetical protein [Corynebacterium sp. HS2168-gen11]